MVPTGKAITRIIGLPSALAGAAIGYWGVGVLARYGFYAIVLPAGLPGIIAGIISRERSIKWAIFYATMGFVAALVTEWRLRPYRADPSLTYFVEHLDRMQTPVVIVIAIGAMIGGVLSISFGRGREQK